MAESGFSAVGKLGLTVVVLRAINAVFPPSLLYRYLLLCLCLLSKARETVTSSSKLLVVTSIAFWL